MFKIKDVKLNSYISKDGETYVEVETEDRRKNYPIHSRELEMKIKKLYLNQTRKMMSDSEYRKGMEYLELKAYDNRLDYNLEIRIAERNGKVYYNLSNDKAVTIVMKDGICKRIRTPKRMFKPSDTFDNQVTPNLEIDINELPKIMGKHFKFQNEEDLKLLILFIVSCFGGLSINIPLLVCWGEKGSGKTTFLRKVKRIIDPEKNDLMTMPKNKSDLQIMLNNSFFVVLDNLSYLSKRDSDLIATTVTGSTAMRRKLYEDTKEIRLDLHCIIGINGISLVTKEADVLDRAVLFQLVRLDDEEIETEKELWESFNTDLPDIVGGCMKTLAIAMADMEEVKLTKKIRMADWMVLAVKVGRVLGWGEKAVEKIIWNNAKKVNEVTLQEDIVATFVIELLDEYDNEYANSVSGLLGDIQQIAKKNNTNLGLLPQSANALSRRLNQVRSNLEMQCGIKYNIRNIGQYREINIWREGE